MQTTRMLCVALLASCQLACTGSPGSSTDSPADAGAADAGTTPWLSDPGADGFQVALPPVEVPAGQQRTVCYFAAVPGHAGDADFWSSRWQIAMPAVAHQLVAYRVRTTVTLDGDPGTMVTDGECLKWANWADWALLVNSPARGPGEEVSEYSTPPDVGHRLQPEERLMVRVQYFNPGTTSITGRAGINFYRATTTPAEELGTIIASKRSVRVCESNPTPTFEGACQMRSPKATIVAASSDMHSRGKSVSAFVWDGVSTQTPSNSDRFYLSESSSEPTVAQGLSVAVPSNGGVWWSCGYEWKPPTAPVTCDALNAAQEQHFPGTTPDCCYAFGDEVPRDEQCTAFIYYAPKADDVNCF